MNTSIIISNRGNRRKKSPKLIQHELTHFTSSQIKDIAASHITGLFYFFFSLWLPFLFFIAAMST